MADYFIRPASRPMTDTVLKDAHIALLRGINVGGKNKLPMKSLVSIFEAAGCKSVQTYIQSGNVVFMAKAALARRIPELVSDAIAKEFGYKVPVVSRTAADLKKVVRANPFTKTEPDERLLHVAFLAKKPTATQAAELDPDRSSPDEFELRGREIYLRCPNGVARTKLTNAYFDSKLATTSTMRNWKTTLKLLALANEIG